MKHISTTLVIILLLCSCNQDEKSKAHTTEETTQITETLPSTSLDPKASALADSTLAAMGGQKKYDDLRYISWTFFGNRELIWDKWAGRVRIDSPKDTSTYILNIHTLEGKVGKGGKEVTDPESLEKEIKRAKSTWINDSYWLVMPFKLKDPGVILKYLRQDSTVNGIPSDVLELTFDKVGDTPNNKYEIYIDQKDKLVKQWVFFRLKDQEKAPRIWPWDNYKEYKGVLLSGDRSDMAGPSNIKVYDELPDAVFESLEKPEME